MDTYGEKKKKKEQRIDEWMKRRKRAKIIYKELKDNRKDLEAGTHGYMKNKLWEKWRKTKKIEEEKITNERKKEYKKGANKHMKRMKMSGKIKGKSKEKEKEN